jgi:transcriptional regulator with XRE-family HTH domain
MITAMQCRMARAGLRWTAAELAKRANVSQTTIARFELEQSKPVPATREVIRRAFEAAGVEFQNGDGVKIRKKKADD